VSARDGIAAVLACAAIGLQVACCLGVLVMRDALARVHYTTPPVLAAALLAAALLVQDGLTQLSGRGVMVALLLALTAPVQAHVIARAIRLRQAGRLAPEERA
jgi:multisubunit Na+/H+ antiporter MnhG subunit